MLHSKANKELVESNEKLANQVQVFFEEKKVSEKHKEDNLTQKK